MWKVRIRWGLVRGRAAAQEAIMLVCSSEEMTTWGFCRLRYRVRGQKALRVREALRSTTFNPFGT